VSAHRRGQGTAGAGGAAGVVRCGRQYAGGPRRQDGPSPRGGERLPGGGALPRPGLSALPRRRHLRRPHRLPDRPRAPAGARPGTPLPRRDARGPSLRDRHQQRQRQQQRRLRRRGRARRLRATHQPLLEAHPHPQRGRHHGLRAHTPFPEGLRARPHLEYWTLFPFAAKKNTIVGGGGGGAFDRPGTYQILISNNLYQKPDLVIK
jgi:hypothetical protein